MSGQIFPANTETIIDFGVKKYDYWNNVTVGSNWKFNCTERALYDINVSIVLNSVSLSEGFYLDLKILKNGTLLKYIDNTRIHDAYNGFFTFRGSGKVRLLETDYLSISVTPTTACGLQPNSTTNYVEIVKIGNY